MILTVSVNGESLRLPTDGYDDLERLLQATNQLVIAGDLQQLAAIRQQIQSWVDAFRSFDDLSEGEWIAYCVVADAFNDALSSMKPGDSRLKELFPKFTEKDWDAFFNDEGEESALYREFYPPERDAESDDSDEDDNAVEQRNSRTHQAQERRGKTRRTTNRGGGQFDPPAVQIKSRMNAMSAGFGKALGISLSVQVEQDDDEAIEIRKIEKSIDSLKKHAKDFSARNQALQDLQRWSMQQYRDAVAKGWKPKTTPASQKELEELLQSIDENTKSALEGEKKKYLLANRKATNYVGGVTTLFASLLGKTSFGTSAMQEGNARILHPPKTLTKEVLDERDGVNDDIKNRKPVRENRFVIAQYRGISYDIDKFVVASRRRSRESVELHLPVYAMAVFRAIGIEAGDYYSGRYQGNKKINLELEAEAIRLKKELVAKRKSGALKFTPAVRPIFLAWSPKSKEVNPSYGKYPNQDSGLLKPDREDALTYDSAAHALQNFYTINYDGFFGLLRHYWSRTAVGRSGGGKESPPLPDDLDESDDRALATMYGGLSNDGNPFASTGKTPRHALRYAYGVKYYTTADMRMKLKPDWTPVGRPRRPYAGKVYISLHPVSDFTDDDAPLDVVALTAQGKLDVSTDILGERESAFPALIPARRIAIEHVARYPSFLGKYDVKYLQKYGLTKREWEAYQLLLATAITEDHRGKILESLSEWLVRFHECRLIEMARALAAASGKILVYRGDDGLLAVGDEATSTFNVSRDSSQTSSERNTLGLGPRLDFEDRETLEGGEEEERKPLPLIGIRNGGNDCYLSSALQFIAPILPNYEMEERTRDDLDLAELVEKFLDTMSGEAANATYLGDWPRVYTRQDLVALRSMVAERNQWDNAYAQQDAVEAVECLLGSFDRSPEQNPDSDALRSFPSGKWQTERASKFHVRRKITRTYDLSSGGQENAIDECTPLDADCSRTTYDVVRVVQLFFPAPPEQSKDEGKEDEEEPVAVPWETLLGAYADSTLDGTETIKASKDGRFYAAAPLVRERVDHVDDSTHFIFQLKRFGVGGTKIVTPVNVPETWDALDLLAVVRHIGTQLKIGHYVAYRKLNGTWYCIDDATVTKYANFPAAEIAGGYLFYYGKP